MPAANGLAAPASVMLEIAGERLQLLSDRALFWARRSTLIVADLHWGKSETFHAAGIPIPGGILEHDLARLSRLLERTGAARLLILGDLIHSGVGLTGRVVDTVAAWRSGLGVSIELVPGNHDRHAGGLPGPWSIRRLEPQVCEGPFLFRHEPGDSAAGRRGCFTLCGHVHPMFRFPASAGSLRLPCLVVGARSAVLPAFGLFTRGLTVEPGAEDRVFAVADGCVIEATRRRVRDPATGGTGRRVRSIAR